MGFALFQSLAMKFICEVGSDKFYMRNDVLSDRVTVNITDLKSLWQVSMTESEIVDRFKVSLIR